MLKRTKIVNEYRIQRISDSMFLTRKIGRNGLYVYDFTKKQGIACGNRETALNLILDKQFESYLDDLQIVRTSYVISYKNTNKPKAFSLKKDVEAYRQRSKKEEEQKKLTNLYSHIYKTITNQKNNVKYTRNTLTLLSKKFGNKTLPKCACIITLNYSLYDPEHRKLFKEMTKNIPNKNLSNYRSCEPAIIFYDKNEAVMFRLQNSDYIKSSLDLTEIIDKAS